MSEASLAGRFFEITRFSPIWFEYVWIFALYLFVKRMSMVISRRCNARLVKALSLNNSMAY